MNFRLLVRFSAPFVAVILSTAAPTIHASDQAKNLLETGRGSLDGMTFAGMFGPAGKPLDKADKLHFNDGQFWSAICIKCGFRPGAYWVRRSDDGLHFRGELKSERGLFTYYGRVDNGRIDVRINWRKERWYWTIDRDFRFEGALEQSRAANSAQNATAVAVSVGPERPPHCPL